MITQNEKDKIVSIEVADFINDIRDRIIRLSDSKKRSQ